MNLVKSGKQRPLTHSPFERGAVLISRSPERILTMNGHNQRQARIENKIFWIGLVVGVITTACAGASIVCEYIQMAGFPIG